MENLRKEYPRPMLVRENWINLNGEWDFEIDNEKSGQEKEYYKRRSLSRKINVPFCPESKLSGIENKDFMDCVWYKRDIEIPKEWLKKDIILHFGAVDYHTYVYVNGEMVGEHKGGYTPFSFPITKFLNDSENYITLCVYDDVRSNNQPGGKQSQALYSSGCFYTRTTGIWQTVWMECVESKYILNIKSTPNVGNQSVTIETLCSRCGVGSEVKIEIYFENELMGECQTTLYCESTQNEIKLKDEHLWEVGQGNLYDIKITLIDDSKITDEVFSYFGLRNVSLGKRSLKINNKDVFGRWVLDQGYYPDGIYTAPSDEDLKKDIECSIALGFNGARLHEKIFEPRFLYWADKLGYIVWGEHGNWCLDITDAKQIQHFLPEWLECLQRDYSHPSIIGWCPFNETWDCDNRRQNDMILKMVYDITKVVDPTRPCIDTSGNFHVVTDIYDIHNYNQDPKTFREEFSNPNDPFDNYANRQTYEGQPYFISEYGGIKWSQAEDKTISWGYGDSPKTQEEFIKRYEELTNVLFDNENMIGFCYTQLYDVEQEQNGLMTYDRKFKFDPEIFHKINTRR